MVEYSNPQPPEGINHSQDNPLKELVVLLLGIIALLAVLVAVVSYSAAWLATKIPFRYERSIGDQVFNSGEYYQHSQPLQALADRVGQAMDLPPDISIQVHYSDEDVVNAFAFLGGHIVVYQGLLDRMESENALAMVLAHEIAHVQHRDVARSLGRGVALSLLMSVIFGNGDNVAGVLVSSGVHTGTLGFNRDQESAADEAALGAVYRLYGHTQGALQLYDVLQAEQEKLPGVLQVEFLNTHPLTENRINRLRELALENGWPDQGLPLPLPAELTTPASH